MVSNILLIRELFGYEWIEIPLSRKIYYRIYNDFSCFPAKISLKEENDRFLVITFEEFYNYVFKWAYIETPPLD